jgi:hypothetical protein
MSIEEAEGAGAAVGKTASAVHGREPAPAFLVLRMPPGKKEVFWLVTGSPTKDPLLHLAYALASFQGDDSG